MTKTKLLQFIKVRNQSEYGSNLQFQIDANECGIKVTDLGYPKRIIDGPVPAGHPIGYCWQTPYGFLVEVSHKLVLYESRQTFIASAGNVAIEEQ